MNDTTATVIAAYKRLLSNLLLVDSVITTQLHLYQFHLIPKIAVPHLLLQCKNTIRF